MKKPRYRKLLALALAAVLLAGTLPVQAQAAKSSEIQKEIDALKATNRGYQSEINAIRGQYKAKYNDMAELVAAKNAIDQEMTLLSARIENTNAQIAAYGQLIADTQDQLELAEADLDQLSQKHRERVRAMEEEGELSYWEVIFKANSFTDLLDRINMVQEIGEADRRRIEQMRIASDIVIATRDSLRQEKDAMEAARLELEADEAVLAERRTESDGLLIQLEKEADEFLILLEESEDKQDELMREIAAKEKELKQAKHDEYLAKLALQGQNPPSDASWISPVSGYTLSSPFGMRKHPILGYQKMHNGIDMACAQGTPIYATRAGTVTGRGYQASGAGNYISINHLDGFASVYYHMTHSVVSVGQTVSQGQLIGYVGSTGLSTGPHLHFGVSYAGTYVNPLAYIY